MARRQLLDEAGFARGPVEVGGSVHYPAKMQFAQQVAVELTAQMGAKNQKDEAVFLMQKLSILDYCEIRLDIGKQGGMEQPDEEAETKELPMEDDRRRWKKMGIDLSTKVHKGAKKFGESLTTAQVCQMEHAFKHDCGKTEPKESYKLKYDFDDLPSSVGVDISWTWIAQSAGRRRTRSAAEA